MNHAFESRPTFYNGVQFRSRLEAQWACFFDQAKWKWDYQPIDLVGWTPTFRVEFPCGHTECSDTHVLLIDVQPFDVSRRLLAIVAWTSHTALVTSQTAKRKAFLPTHQRHSVSIPT